MAKDVNKPTNQRTARRTIAKGAAAAAAGAGAAAYIKPGLRSLGVPAAAAAPSVIPTPTVPGVTPTPTPKCGRMTGGGDFDAPIISGSLIAGGLTNINVAGTTVYAAGSLLTSTTGLVFSAVTGSYSDGITLYCCFAGNAKGSGVDFNLRWTTTGLNHFHMTQQVQTTWCGVPQGTVFGVDTKGGFTTCNGDPIPQGSGGTGASFRTITGFGIGWFSPDGDSTKYRASIIFQLTDNHEANQTADKSSIQVYVDYSNPYKQQDETSTGFCVGVGTLVVDIANADSKDKGNYQAHDT